MQREEKTRSSAAELAIDDGIVGKATGTKECISALLCAQQQHIGAAHMPTLLPFSAQDSSETPTRHAAMHGDD